MLGKYTSISTVALVLSLGLTLPQAALADAKGSIRLIKAEKAYLQAKEEWKRNKKKYEAYISKRDKIDQEHAQKEAQYWQSRQNFMLEHARELNQTRTDRNRFEKTYREKRRVYDQLNRERDNAYAELTRLNLFIDKGTATGIEKIKAKKLRAKVDALDENIKTELQAQKKLQADFKKADSAHKAKVRDLWDNQPKKSALFDIDEIHKIRREELKRPLTSFELERNRATAESTALAFFAELLKNQPIYVKQVEAIGAKGVWYKAVWDTDPLATAQQPSQLTQEGYAKAISDIDAEIAEIDKEIETGNKLLKKLRTEWEEQNAIASNALQTIADNEVENAVIAASIETGAVIGAFAVSGGTAAPAAHGAASSLIAYISGPGAKQVAKMSAELLGKGKSLIRETMQRHTLRKTLTYTKRAVTKKGPTLILKYRKAKKGTGIAWFKFVTDMFASKGANFGFNHEKSNLVGEKGVMRAALGIGVGDAIETGLSGGWRDFATSVTGKVGSKAASATQLSQARAAAGVAAAATASKMAVRFLYDVRKDSLEWDAYLANSAAMASQYAYFAALAVRKGYEVQKSYLDESKKALEHLKEHGPRSLKKVVSIDNAIVRDDVEKVRITFSQPLDNPPSVTVNARYTGPLRPFEGSNKVWEATLSPSLFKEETKKAKLRIKISEKERPFKKLDANPKTPLELTSLERGSWRGFEKGLDTHHTLKLRKKDEESDQAVIPCPFTTTIKFPVLSDGTGGCDVFNPQTQSCLIRKYKPQNHVTTNGHLTGGLCLNEAGSLIKFTDPDTGVKRHYFFDDHLNAVGRQQVNEMKKLMNESLGSGQELQKQFRSLKSTGQ